MQVLEALVAPTVMAVLFIVLMVTILRGLNPLRQQARRGEADRSTAGTARRTDEDIDEGIDDGTAQVGVAQVRTGTAASEAGPDAAEER